MSVYFLLVLVPSPFPNFVLSSTTTSHPDTFSRMLPTNNKTSKRKTDGAVLAQDMGMGSNFAPEMMGNFFASTQIPAVDGTASGPGEFQEYLTVAASDTLRR